MTDEQVAIDSAEFRKVLGHFPTGVTVVAAVHEGQPAGLAVGSFFSISLDPPLVGFCVGKESSSWATVRAAGHFVVNVLSDNQIPISGAFAGTAADKFDGVDWTPAVSHGGPHLDGCVAHIDCVIHDVLPGGDHDIVVGRVIAMDLHRGGDGPLLFFKGRYGRLADLES